MTSKLLLWFNEISKEDVPLVGGKSASLGEMSSKTKVPVPYGFALTADAYRLFIRENGIENKIADALKPLIDSNDTVMLQKVGALLAFGVFIEWIQSFLPWRSADLFDFLADCIGIACYLIPAILSRLVSSLRES